MARGFVAMPILLWFLFAPCYHSLVEPIHGGSNPLPNVKNGVLLVPKLPFQLVQGAGFQDGEGDTISHYAMKHTKPGNFHGLRAEMSVWGSPNQQPSQDSGSAIQIYCQDGRKYSLIEVGFHVSPSLYHNRDVRFFTYSTKDTKSAGCYDLQCAGFVPAKGAALVPGQAISPTSIYGQADHYARLSLNEDPNSGDWVVYRHDLATPSFLGQFPKNFCPTTSRILALTGFVNYFKNTSGPPMGSGHVLEEYTDVTRSGYFKHVKIYDSKGNARDPITTHFHDLVDKPDCYRASDFFLDFLYKKGYLFFYGGPGGCVG